MQYDLVDIGANLANNAFRDDLDDVLARARAAGVGTMVVTGTSAAISAAAVDVAVGRPGLVATAGIHPHFAANAGRADYEEIRDLLFRREVVAAGECGLDYNRNYSSPKSQVACFEAQLAMAAEARKPVFMHERDATDAFLGVLREHRPRLGPAVVHCFTGDRRALQAYLDLDLHIGITGWICDERRGAHLRDLVLLIPRDRLMIESDAPYLLPRTMPDPPRNRRNEPAFLPFVLASVAAALRRTPAEVAAETSATARAFFGLAGTRQHAGV